MNKVYSNYFSGSVHQVSNCLEIILYNKYSFTDKISLYNLEEFYLKHLTGTSENYVRLYRENVSDEFEYKKSLSLGFNIIVYISNFSNAPIGYTEFVNTQGSGISLKIKTTIERTTSEDLVSVKIKNNISGKSSGRVFQGKELCNYVTQEEVKEKRYRNLFTSDIGRTESDIYSFIISSSGIITKEGSWKLKVKKNIDVGSGFSHFNICFYSGILVLAVWEENRYKLFNLMNGEELISSEENCNIKRIEGKYFYDEENVLKYLDDGGVVEKKKDTLFCDYLDPHNTLYDLPTFYSSSTIFKYIPEINNIYLDLDNYLKSSPVTVYSKIGHWFILLLDCGGYTIYQAVSPTSVINMTKEDLNDVVFVGDQTIVLHEKGDNDHEGYYLVYDTYGKELITERARAEFENGRLDWLELDQNGDKKYSIKFCFLDNTEEDDKHFEEYFGDNGLVSLIYECESIEGTVLKKYRRNIYPGSNGIPEIVGSFGGLIFYKKGSMINYL